MQVVNRLNHTTFLNKNFTNLKYVFDRIFPTNYELQDALSRLSAMVLSFNTLQFTTMHIAQ